MKLRRNRNTYCWTRKGAPLSRNIRNFMAMTAKFVHVQNPPRGCFSQSERCVIGPKNVSFALAFCFVSGFLNHCLGYTRRFTLIGFVLPTKYIQFNLHITHRALIITCICFCGNQRTRFYSWVNLPAHAIRPRREPRPDPHLADAAAKQPPCRWKRRNCRLQRSCPSSLKQQQVGDPY